MDISGQETLKKLLGDLHYEQLTEQHWNQVKETLTVGDVVQGKVVRKAPFGDWIDLGIGFPGLLEIILIPNMDSKVHQEQTYNPVGSVLEARIVGFRDDPQYRQIYLSQLDTLFLPL